MGNVITGNRKMYLCTTDLVKDARGTAERKTIHEFGVRMNYKEITSNEKGTERNTVEY